MEHFTDSEVAQLYSQHQDKQNSDRFSELEKKIERLEACVVAMLFRESQWVRKPNIEGQS